MVWKNLHEGLPKNGTYISCALKSNEKHDSCIVNNISKQRKTVLATALSKSARFEVAFLSQPLITYLFIQQCQLLHGRATFSVCELLRVIVNGYVTVCNIVTK